MPVLSTWFSVLELKGTYVTLRTFSSSTETVLCTSTSTSTTRVRVREILLELKKQ
jgi:hypothetical protein